MYGSQAMSKDLNLPFPASPFRLAKDEIDLSHQHGHHHQQQEQQHHQQQQMGSGGLLRYRSAPGTVLGDLCEEFLPNRAPAPEEEPMYARFMAPDLRDLLGDKQGVSAPQPVPTSEVAPPHLLFQLHQHHQHQQHQQPHPQPPMPNITCSTTVAATAAENLFRPMVSIGMEQQQEHPKAPGGSSLIRHSSSPAGLFTHLNVDNGFASMRAAADPSGSGSSSGRLKGPHLGFSPRHGTSFMTQISEMDSDGLGGSPDGEDGSRGSAAAAAARCYLPGYPVASWDDSASVLLNDGLQSGGGGRRPRDPSELQNGDLRGHPHLPGSLAHHLSLPVLSRTTDMGSVDRFLQFQDAVPCKLRAKRGCATHPRSIAERVRRTRISERMRKLQELVPNMDKQTNTADMLDLAVEYIKELERQAKALSDGRAKCTCSASGQRNSHQDYHHHQ